MVDEINLMKNLTMLLIVVITPLLLIVTVLVTLKAELLTLKVFCYRKVIYIEEIGNDNIQFISLIEQRHL